MVRLPFEISMRLKKNLMKNLKKSMESCLVEVELALFVVEEDVALITDILVFEDLAAAETYVVEPAADVDSIATLEEDNVFLLINAIGNKNVADFAAPTNTIAPEAVDNSFANLLHADADTTGTLPTTKINGEEIAEAEIPLLALLNEALTDVTDEVSPLDAPVDTVSLGTTQKQSKNSYLPMIDHSKFSPMILLIPLIMALHSGEICFPQD